MKLGQLLSGAVVCCLAAAAPAFADVQVTMQNGRVSVVAKDATLRQILTEWARVGQTKVVNVERIPGAPMTIELRDIPEAQALEILLRSLSGYLAAPRPAQAANLSRFDRIVVMPTVAAARQPASVGTPAPPVFQPQPMPQQVIQPADPNEEEEKPPAPPQPGGPRPVFNAFPQPQIVNPNGAMPGAQPPQGAEPPVPPPPSAFPTAAPGVSVPGMIVPAPPPPPNANPNQVRRPGGQVGQ